MRSERYEEIRKILIKIAQGFSRQQTANLLSVLFSELQSAAESEVVPPLSRKKRIPLSPSFYFFISILMKWKLFNPTAFPLYLLFLFLV